MANPIGINGTHSRQERYNNEIVPLYRKLFVVRSEFGRNYEGNPVSGAVNVPVRDVDPTISDYNISTGANLTQSATTFMPIPLTKHIAINEIIDGYEAAAVPDDIRAQRLEAGAYALGLKLETNAITELETNGTVLADTTPLTNANAYTSIKDQIIELKSQGITTNDLVCFVDADTEALLLEDEKFANSAGQLGAELLRDGVIGKIAGVRVKPSYNLSATTEFIVFGKPWAEAIDEWKVDLTINNLGNNFIGASALQGRMIYEDVLTRADACRVKARA